jgi:hypothetical protein
MRKTTERKKKQLGMNPSTAANRLTRMILFELVQQTKKDDCFKCGEKIESYDTMSIEHKVDWLHSDSPAELFWDLGNIAFSHKCCNKSRYLHMRRKK